MITGILREPAGEKRVAMLPAEAALLKKLGAEVIIEKNAGLASFSADEEYLKNEIPSFPRQEIFTRSDLILSVNSVPLCDLDLCREGQVLCSVVNVAENREWLEKARSAGLTVLALDIIPRTTRAQAMDILSSMATVSGYKAVLDAANRLPAFFPMFMSAAGTIKPARMLILGAGVAGLQALAIARKLGAVVEVFDVRSAVREEVESLGGRFVEVEGAREDQSAGGYAVEQTEEFQAKQRELIQQRAIASDVVIASAQIPGKRAPLLLQGETVRSMKPGSVIIDLAASSGGNCELTENGKIISVNGVEIVGKSDYPSDMPADASKMFGNNIVNFMKILLGQEGSLMLDMENEIIRGTTAVHAGEYVSDRARQLLNIK
ncbi:MAG TPA: NAD(P) transhydrogenase subunit alpha [Bacteroidales bacterium]|jgi:NAD(P) transhydrogenase subunit alpha|nr:NAD(P) transhydrogenase subunit alpha [Bacteroidales bacterium]HQH23943.1 NAD(P) transhydrogenase subunit alpha [Bacteroidales bacterium]HQJ81273.1 NAD(P) transhydrogenase subunit alpha [Bacteroidales bacterium]